MARVYKIVGTDDDHEWADARTQQDAVFAARTLAREESQGFVVLDPAGREIEWVTENGDSLSLQGAFRCTPDESGGYDISDPKHPHHHSTYADIYDAREGK